ncbi:hypothetical protein H0H93_004019 [Arthromyces matolae]|nr:hypothetical protein H0H93_004019 [Arthromyces matolae]
MNVDTPIDKFATVVASKDSGIDGDEVDEGYVYVEGILTVKEYSEPEKRIIWEFAVCIAVANQRGPGLKINPDSPATVEEDDITSPQSPHSRSGSFNYAERSSASFDSPISPPDMYDSNLHSHSYPSGPQSFQSHSNSSQPNYEFVAADPTIRTSQFGRSFPSESPSPVDPHSSSYPSATHPLPDRRASQPSYLPHDRYDTSTDIDSDRYTRNIASEKYPQGNNSNFQATSLDQRRMSEPAILAPLNTYSATPSHRVHSQSNFPPSSLTVPRSSAYVPSLQRGASMGNLRDLRLAHLDYSTQYPGWKDSHHQRSHHLGSYHGDDGFDAPISPLQPDFSGGLGPRVQYSPTADNLYGASPPGTGTSTSSLGPLSPTADSFAHKDDPNSRDNNSKTYSFVALPGNTVKKRPRRRYDEIERLYQCSWPDCNKAYGTLNHLNAHVTMQKHGVKRQPSEFKELRKQWRKAKKSASPGPVRRNSVNLRHEGQEYNTRRFSSQSESSVSSYSRQPSFSSSSGLPSSAPSILADPIDRMSLSIDERDEHFAIYGTHGRQRYAGSAQWQGSSRPNPQQSYLSSSLPSQSSATGFPLDNNMQRSRSQSSIELSIGRLPPDSTLLTPLPGYQPSLLPPLHESDSRDISYPPANNYGIFDNVRDGRPQSGHGSLADN